MAAYYSENDPFAAAWLRELIKTNLIAPGEVDERDIREVQPEDVKGFTQQHYFAGIGCWSFALRNAGWPDSRRVVTGSCPCPPFSSAGKSKACPRCGGTNPVPHVGRTGYFVCCLCDHEWFADARHLWPELWRLISVCRPDYFFGEQVASGDGRTWLASVRASLEILGYAVGATDTCSAGVGASDIRQRLYFVADSQRQQLRTVRSGSTERAPGAMQGIDGQRERLWVDDGERGATDGMADTTIIRIGAGLRSSGSGERGGLFPSNDCGDDELGNTTERRQRITRSASRESGHLAFSDSNGGMGELNGSRSQPGREASQTAGHGRSTEPASGLSGMANTGDTERRASSVGRNDDHPEEARWNEGAGGDRERSPLSGFWADAEWIYCRDGKYRPIPRAAKSDLEQMDAGLARELGLVRLANQVEVYSPLIEKGKNRVGRLRGYGNSINSELATVFIACAMDVLDAKDE